MTQPEVLEASCDGLTHRFRLSLDGDAVTEAVEQRLRAIARHIRLPGFRPGRAPIDVLRRQQGPAVRTDVTDRMAIAAARRIIAERGLEPVRRPIVDVEAASNAPEADVTFMLELQVTPEVVLAPLDRIPLRPLRVPEGEPQLAREADLKLREQLFDALLERHDFAVPEDMVDNEFRRIAAGFVAEVGEAVDAEIEAELRQIALRRIRLAILLTEIGRHYGLTVPRSEIEALIERQAERDPAHQTEIIDYYLDHPSALAELQSPLFEDRVVAFLLERADIEEVVLEPEALRAALDAT